MAAGDFSASELGVVTTVMGKMFKERPIAQADRTILNLGQRQTASFEMIKQGEECRGYDVVFLKDCDNTVVDCEATPPTDCDLGGVEAESARVSYTIDKCLSKDFAVKEFECKKNVFDKAFIIARRTEKAIRDIVTELNKRGVSFLESNAFTPASPTYGTVLGSEIQFPEADWSPELIAKLMYVANVDADMATPFSITGKNFWIDDFVNKYKVGGGCCTVNTTDGGPIDLIFDLKTVDSITGSNSTFMVDPDSYAFVTMTKNQDLAFRELKSDLYARRAPVPGLFYSDNGVAKQVYVDIYKQISCSGNMVITENYRVQLSYDIWLAPDVCDNGNTGILHFTQS